MRSSLFSLHWFGVSGTIDFSHCSTLSLSRSSIARIVKRFCGLPARSSTQLATSIFHNPSVNPDGGLPGRAPRTTRFMTTKAEWQSLNGRHPVRTYQELGCIFQWVEERTYLDGCHPHRVYVCAHRGELFQILTRESEELRVNQFRSHPPRCASCCTIGNCAPSDRFINSHGEPEVRKSGTTRRVDEDVGLATTVFRQHHLHL